MAEYIMEFDEALYNEETDEAVFEFEPEIKGELIRCKDCEYFHNYCGHMFCTNAKAMFDVQSDYYCSYAEKREEE